MLLTASLIPADFLLASSSASSCATLPESLTGAASVGTDLTRFGLIAEALVRSLSPATSDFRFLFPVLEVDADAFFAAFAAARALARSCSICVWYSCLGFSGNHQIDPVPDPNPSDGSNGSEQLGHGSDLSSLGEACSPELFSLGEEDPEDVDVD